jgi:Xaa-Pro aminopeptidase
VNYIHQNENAIYYECGYSCDNAIFLKLGSENFFITDSRYELEAKEGVKNGLVLIERDLYRRANRLIKKSKIKKLKFDPKEWSIFQFENLSRGLKVEFKAEVDLSHRRRIIKRETELEMLQTSVKLGAEAFDRFAEKILKRGIGKDEFYLTYMVNEALSKRGRYELSFNPIVAIDENASKPHAMPTKKILSRGDLLLVDAGLKYKRYCSDRTRTVHLKDNFSFSIEQKFKDRRIQRAYDTVLKAHDRAIEGARAGMRAKEIDSIAREIVHEAGFGKYFVHSTGHGVGLDIHEMPYIASKSETVIEDGMVFTIEPGIYIPDEFGIRIEDMVAMVDGRAIIL